MNSQLTRREFLKSLVILSTISFILPRFEYYQVYRSITYTDYSYIIRYILLKNKEFVDSFVDFDDIPDNVEWLPDIEQTIYFNDYGELETIIH